MATSVTRDLPPVVPLTKGDGVHGKLKLTPAQQEAINHPEDCAIIAAPGSGKTLLLVEKVATLVEEKKVPLEKILLVTFTERAAAELKGRLASRLKRSADSLTTAPIGTLHSYFTDLLRREGSRVGIAAEFKILEESIAGLQKIRFCHQTLVSALQARDAGAVAFTDHFGFHPAVRLASKLLTKNSSNTVYANFLSSLQSAYQAKKRGLNCLDFHDLETIGLQLLAEPEVRRGEQSRFQWILVDEFQDTSPLQWKMISLLHTPGHNHRVVVGDPRQSIYRFRGAHPEIFGEAIQQIQATGGKLFHLDENFRSLPSLLEFVNQLSPRLFPDFPRPILPQRPPDEGGVETIAFDATGPLEQQRRGEAAAVVPRILSLHQSGVDWHQIALLFRTRLAMPFYEAALREHSVPLETVAGEPLLERPEVLAVCFALQRALSQNPLATLGLSYSPLKDFSEPPPAEPESFVEYLSRMSSRFESDPFAFQNLQEFQKWVARLLELEPMPAAELLEVIQILRDEEAHLPCPEPPRSEAQKGVRLLTVHAAKGLEFHTVILCDLDARPATGRPPFLETAGEILFKEKSEEETGLKDKLAKSDRYEAAEKQEREADQMEAKRLLYVALTRAKNRLILPHCNSEKRTKGSWRDWIVSE